MERVITSLKLFSSIYEGYTCKSLIYGLNKRIKTNIIFLSCLCTHRISMAWPRSSVFLVYYFTRIWVRICSWIYIFIYKSYKVLSMVISSIVRIFFLHYTAASFLAWSSRFDSHSVFYCFTEMVCLLLLFTGFVERHLPYNNSLLKAEVVFCNRGTRCLLQAW